MSNQSLYTSNSSEKPLGNHKECIMQGMSYSFAKNVRKIGRENMCIYMNKAGMHNSDHVSNSIRLMKGLLVA